MSYAFPLMMMMKMCYFYYMHPSLIYYIYLALILILQNAVISPISQMGKLKELKWHIKCHTATQYNN